MNRRQGLGGRRPAKIRVILISLAVCLLMGCATQPYNPYMYTGAGLGAAAGAALGAGINHSNPWKGAAIGGLLGGALGGIGGEIYGRNNPMPAQYQSQGYYYQQPSQQPGYQQQPQPYYGPPSG